MRDDLSAEAATAIEVDLLADSEPTKPATKNSPKETELPFTPTPK